MTQFQIAFARTRRIGFSCGLLLLLTCGIAGCRSPGLGAREDTESGPPAARVEALNALRNDINAQYGYRDGAPRINLGPCGRFAKLFREQWNARFAGQVNIAFIMSGDGSNCHHVLVKFPDGSYFDGGNGVVTENALMKFYADSRIEEMKEFDLKLLDKRSYGLNRNYPECPSYSDDFSASVIGRRLAALPNNRRRR